MAKTSVPVQITGQPNAGTVPKNLHFPKSATQVPKGQIAVGTTNLNRGPHFEITPGAPAPEQTNRKPSQWQR